jgi:hypothetical protein
MPQPLASRGRITKWTKEKLNTLSKIELTQLLENAERLKEPEVAAFCRELLSERRKKKPAAPGTAKAGTAKKAAVPAAATSRRA